MPPIRIAELQLRRAPVGDLDPVGVLAGDQDPEAPDRDQPQRGVRGEQEGGGAEQHARDADADAEAARLGVGDLARDERLDRGVALGLVAAQDALGAVGLLVDPVAVALEVIERAAAGGAAQRGGHQQQHRGGLREGDAERVGDQRPADQHRQPLDVDLEVPQTGVHRERLPEAPSRDLAKTGDLGRHAPTVNRPRATLNLRSLACRSISSATDAGSRSC